MAENKVKVEPGAQAKKEEEILNFWREHQVFEQTVAREPKEGEFVFYDGPPFATGTPHFGHLLPTSLKDAIPRYQTMRGKRVRRRWGWDCHGLPVENVVEKDLNFKTKKDILDFGIDKFNAAAREAVLRYTDEWEKVIPRLGRWVDMQNSYRTMDPSYTETVWQVFKTLHEQNLIYEGYKSMHICPRCETTLSNFEVNQGYKDIEDLSVTVKFELSDEPGTYFLAWTTTPWTLPGNVALAVNPNFTYVRAAFEGSDYILAEERLNETLKGEYEVKEKFLGRELAGKNYKSVFGYYQAEGQIYPADFVLLEEGTGIVHIAPAFGDDDYQLCQKESLPFIQHVGMDGTFKPEVTDFAGLKVKPKGNHQETDKLVLKKLEEEGKVFKIERVTHSYPHCWRCETPLLNYAANSWFVKVTEFKDKLVAANSQVNWVPEHIKEGRFGRWLEGARDWAISRSRFWGAPLPVWKCEKCDEVKVFGSVKELSAFLAPTRNAYFVIRHGEGDHNVANIMSAKAGNPHHLTARGRREVEDSVSNLKDKVDLIIASPFIRTKETAEIASNLLGGVKVIYDDRLKEVDFGEFDNQTHEDYLKYVRALADKFNTPLGGGETLTAVHERVQRLFNDLEKEYQDKNILVVTHEAVLRMMEGVAQGLDAKNSWLLRTGDKDRIKPGQMIKLSGVTYPKNGRGELDLHRPYIDEVKLKCACGGEMARVPEVFDCWFESGSMPYFGEQSFPAEFIAEGLDQTRGWFYSLLVLGTALKGESPYKNVVVNGLILAEDGQKMSKRLKNYPDILETIDKYGADALRFYLLSTPAVRAEDFAFSEADLSHTYRQVIQRLMNVLNFYLTYAGGGAADPWVDSQNVLDQWILARLSQVQKEVTTALDNYELDRACRPINDFIDDLSNWYVRRSRDRFKSDDVEDREAAKATTAYVLKSLAKIMAPIIPFTAEAIYQVLKVETEEASVHLSAWPEINFANEELIKDMLSAREAVEMALAARQTAGIKVRQPLATLTINKELPEKLRRVLAEEVNVKEVKVDLKQAEAVALDTSLSAELEAEGAARDFIRAVQELRKKNGLQPGEEIALKVGTNEEGESLLKPFLAEIKKAVSARALSYESASGEEVTAGGRVYQVAIER